MMENIELDNERQKTESLIPVPSILTNSQNQLLLIDPGYLNFNYGLAGPLKIARTAFSVNGESSWSVCIEEAGSLSSLLSSKNVDATTDSIDLVKLLGTRLTIMPWQKLLVTFESASDFRTGLSFVVDDSRG